jgi:hypothetical protein
MRALFCFRRRVLIAIFAANSTVSLTYKKSLEEVEEHLTGHIAQNGIAEYEITEVIPTKYAQAFEEFVN